MLTHSAIDPWAAEAAAHARSVLREVRTTKNRGSNYVLSDVECVAAQLSVLIDLAADRGGEYTLYWRGKWLTRNQATTALAEVQATLAGLRPSMRMAA